MSTRIINPENQCANVDVIPLDNIENKLETIFAYQKKLQLLYGNDLQNLDNQIEKPIVVKDMVLALTDELHELLNRTPWKPWRNYKVPEDFNPSQDEVKEIKMELVDILHFFVNLCLIFNLSAQELFDFYMAKNSENIKRINRGYSKVATK